MANDFSGDVNCKGVWRFESGAAPFLADTSAGWRADGGDKPQTLVQGDANLVAENTTDYDEGLCSADFELSLTEWFKIADADLCSGFPMQNGDTNKKISITARIRAETLPTGTGSRYFVAKYDTGYNKRSFALSISNVSDVHYLRFTLGHTGGTAGEIVNMVAVTNMTVNQWYRIGFTYQDSDKSWYCKVYDVTNATAYEASGNTTNNINVEDAIFTIGCALNSATYLTGWDGEIDELVIFNDILSEAEIDQIRGGTYGAGTTAPPTTLAPTTLAPTTVLSPTTLAPTAAPTTLAPTAAPTTSPPTTSPPTTLAPTTLPPTTLAPTTPEPSRKYSIFGGYILR